MKTFKQFLGPEATEQQDKEEIARQKHHLNHKAQTSYEQSEREGGGGAARAKGDAYTAAKNNIKEDAMAAAPANSVAGVAGTGDSRLPASQREPGVFRKRTPIFMRMAKRKLPNM